MLKKLFIFLIFVLPICSCGFPKPVQTGNYAENKEWEVILRKTQARYRGLDAANLIGQIKLHLGTPYKYGGTNRSGMDCSGFVMTVFDNAFSAKLPHNAQQIFNKTKTIPLKNIKLGDLVFFGDSKKNAITHVGIYLTDTHFAHASSVKGVTISSFRKNYYKERFKGVHRVLKLRFS